MCVCRPLKAQTKSSRTETQPAPHPRCLYLPNQYSSCKTCLTDAALTQVKDGKRRDSSNFCLWFLWFEGILVVTSSAEEPTVCFHPRLSASRITQRQPGRFSLNLVGQGRWFREEAACRMTFSWCFMLQRQILDEWIEIHILISYLSLRFLCPSLWISSSFDCL